MVERITPMENEKLHTVPRKNLLDDLLSNIILKIELIGSRDI
tara:strand:+ start:268 stop:393 length:126 start_codon:yes stop_codon:yes gene_type:complete